MLVMVLIDCFPQLLSCFFSANDIYEEYYWLWTTIDCQGGMTIGSTPEICGQFFFCVCA